nr:uncharacterized protein LOC128697303 [Cherax quadricarinatus]
MLGDVVEITPEESVLISGKAAAQESTQQQQRKMEESRKKGQSMSMTRSSWGAQDGWCGVFSFFQKAVANCGWIGVLLLVVFCVAIGFSGTRLGKCWMLLEERWPQQYKNACRTPYLEIAERSMGPHARRLVLVCMLTTLLGGTIVFLILVASFMNQLVVQVSLCEWVLITAVLLLPLTWLGTPKDFWQASVLAATATAVACIVIFIELILEADAYKNPIYQNPTVDTFALGFGAILFAFGGASVFPTIQNDMGDRSLFSKAVVVAFVVLLVLYLPVATAGYVIQGIDVNDNVLLAVDSSKGIVKAAIVLQVINLLGTYVISFNPISQTFEDLLGIDNKFGWKRCVLRSVIVILEVVVGLAIPDFGKILNLIGGSSVTVCTFVMPPLMYMRLMHMKNSNWTQRHMELWETVLLSLIAIVGVVGGITSTVTAIIEIINPDSLSTSCFSNFNL